jgi:hypothetical protein
MQKLGQPQLQKNRTTVQSSSVSVFFQFDELDLQTLSTPSDMTLMARFLVIKVSIMHN